MAEQNTGSEDLKGLAKLFGWVDRPGSLTVIVVVLVIASAVSVGWDFTYEKYGYFMEETWIGAYAAFGFVAFTIVIFAARGLRVLIGQPENYYGTSSTDGEEMTAEGEDA